MIIGGLQKTTLIDYPGKIAATVFLAGCNFRCGFCYSSSIVLPEDIKKLPKFEENAFFDFLDSNKGLLEGVVICGGEPTLNNDLPEFIKNIKDRGFVVKLDTNGSNPKMLGELINGNLIDYVAMDIKAPKEKYQKITNRKVNIKDIEKSILLLKQGKIGYEFRTTVAPDMLDKNDIIKIAQWISPAQKYFLQNFRAENNIDPKMQKMKPYPDEYLQEIQKSVAPFFEVCQIR